MVTTRARAKLLEERHNQNARNLDIPASTLETAGDRNQAAYKERPEDNSMAENTTNTNTNTANTVRDTIERPEDTTLVRVEHNFDIKPENIQKFVSALPQYSG